MPSAKTPAHLLKQNRDRVTELLRKAGDAKTRRLLERAQDELSRRLRTARGLRGAGSETFTAAQMNATLKQIEEVLRPLKQGLAGVIVDEGTVVAEAAASGALTYLHDAEKAFTGINQGLQLREAALLDRAVAGTEASILRRIGTDPQHPGQPGVLDRYGMNVIGDFEDILQQRFVQRMPWSVVRDAITEASPFLQGKPAFWAERIVRTEVIAANNRAAAEAINQANDELGDMVKILSSTFDARTGADSIAIHGQIRRPSEAFESWFGPFQNPPDRPNDRAVVVPHRIAWPIPDALLPRSDAEVLARWSRDGRKGSPPSRPLMTTVPLDQFGKPPPAPPPSPIGPAAPDEGEQLPLFFKRR